MNYSTDIKTSAGILGGLTTRISAALADFRRARARRAVYVTTLTELRGLSDRDLADLGLRRSELPEVAHAAAYAD